MTTILAITPGQDSAAITTIVRDAAARTGIDFNFLLAQAKAESGLNPTAQARTSSARGLYQFTSATWLEMVRRHGSDHGLGWAADMINSGAANAGSAARATILALRDNAQAAALMAGEFAGDNAAILKSSAAPPVPLISTWRRFSGRRCNALPVGHGAQPGRRCRQPVSREAAANASIFFGAMAARARWRKSMTAWPPGSAALPAPRSPRLLPWQAGQSQLPAIDAGRARLAYLLLAELGG